MMAGLADLLGSQREYYLFDSFEGLPPATPIDGPALQTWQANVTGPGYHNNCTATATQAEAAMKQSSATRYSLIKGWFDETVPAFDPNQKIALLRLDGDLYESTTVCLKYLYSQVADEGIIIIDDYQPWDGCARAVHEFLAYAADTGETPRLQQYDNDVFFLSKRIRRQIGSTSLQCARDEVSLPTVSPAISLAPRRSM
jgi:hypothetical protein